MAETDDNWLAGRFEEARPRMNAVARRLLGSASEADDAIQEAWLRLARSDASGIRDLTAWLTTVVARVCLDQLRRRKVRAEEDLDEEILPTGPAEEAPGPEKEALLAESVGQAMLLVLDRLTPAERVAFVLHDLFDLPFRDVASILERTEDGVRQLASRARRRVRLARGQEPSCRPGNRAVVEAFLTASRQGDFSALLALLHPKAVLKADAFALQAAAANQNQGAPLLEAEMRGAGAVAGAFKGRARGARLVLLNGRLGAAWIHEGKVRSLFDFSLEAGSITAIHVIMDPAALAATEVEPLD